MATRLVPAAKILVFALYEATGFVGGPFFPMLVIGGTTAHNDHRDDPKPRHLTHRELAHKGAA